MTCARQGCFGVLSAARSFESGRRRKTSSPAEKTLPRLKRGAPVRRAVQSYFGGGAGVKTSRLCAGSGLGFGLGAFLTSFLPLSLLPMGRSVTQKGVAGKGQKSLCVGISGSGDAPGTKQGSREHLAIKPTSRPRSMFHGTGKVGLRVDLKCGLVG